MENNFKSLYRTIKGLTVREDKNGSLLIKIHVKDLIASLSKFKLQSNGTILAIASKRNSPVRSSSIPYTHHEPELVEDGDAKEIIDDEFHTHTIPTILSPKQFDNGTG